MQSGGRPLPRWPRPDGFQCLACLRTYVGRLPRYPVQQYALPGTAQKVFPQTIKEQNPDGLLCQLCVDKLQASTKLMVELPLMGVQRPPANVATEPRVVSLSPTFFDSVYKKNQTMQAKPSVLNIATVPNSAGNSTGSMVQLPLSQVPNNFTHPAMHKPRMVSLSPTFFDSVYKKNQFLQAKPSVDIATVANSAGNLTGSMVHMPSSQVLHNVNYTHPDFGTLLSDQPPPKNMAIVTTKPGVQEIVDVPTRTANCSVSSSQVPTTGNINHAQPNLEMLPKIQHRVRKTAKTKPSVCNVHTIPETVPVQSIGSILQVSSSHIPIVSYAHPIWASDMSSEQPPAKKQALLGLRPILLDIATIPTCTEIQTTGSVVEVSTSDVAHAQPMMAMSADPPAADKALTKGAPSILKRNRPVEICLVCKRTLLSEKYDIKHYATPGTARGVFNTHIDIDDPRGYLCKTCLDVLMKVTVPFKEGFHNTLRHLPQTEMRTVLDDDKDLYLITKSQETEEDFNPVKDEHSYSTSTHAIAERLPIDAMINETNLNQTVKQEKVTKKPQPTIKKGMKVKQSQPIKKHKIVIDKDQPTVKVAHKLSETHRPPSKELAGNQPHSTINFVVNQFQQPVTHQTELLNLPPSMNYSEKPQPAIKKETEVLQLPTTINDFVEQPQPPSKNWTDIFQVPAYNSVIEKPQPPSVDETEIFVPHRTIKYGAVIEKYQPNIKVETVTGPAKDPPEIDQPDLAEDDCPEEVPEEELPKPLTKRELHLQMLDKVHQHNLNSTYERGFLLLAKNNKRAHKALVSAFTKLLKIEMRESLSRQPPYLREPVSTLDNVLEDEHTLRDFSWESVVSECEDKMPLVHAVLDTIVPKVQYYQTRLNKKIFNKQKNSLKLAEAQRNFRMGTLFSSILYTIKPFKYNLVQSLVAVHLHVECMPRKLHTQLHKLGVVTPPGNVRIRFTLLEGVQERRSIELKEEAEERLVSSTEQTVSYSLSVESLLPLRLSPASKPHHCEGSERLLGLPTAVRHRVVPWDDPVPPTPTECPTSPAIDLPLETFLPDDKARSTLRQALIHKVKAILIKNLDCLGCLRSDDVKPFIPKDEDNEHSKQLAKMSTSSEIINLGVISAGPDEPHPSPASLPVALTREVPEFADGYRRPLLIHGDVETLVQLMDAQTAPDAGQLGLLHMLDVAPEFQKELRLAKDLMKKMYGTSRSLAARTCPSNGTLHHIKELFYSSSRPDELDMIASRIYSLTNITDCWDLCKLTTEGLTVLLALKLADMSSMKAKVPEAVGNTGNQRKILRAWMDRLAQRVVERVWVEPEYADTQTIRDTYTDDSLDSRTRDHNDSDESEEESSSAEATRFPYCSCRTDTGEEMVRCHNSRCPVRRFHLSCARPALKEAPDSDWYCSKACNRSHDYIYCVCQRYSGDTLVQCNLGPQCHRHEWYHLRCLGKKTDDLPEEWYCSDECALGQQRDDAVLEYSLSLAWQGLNLLVRRDAVRLGHGPLMLTLWQHDMLAFWNNDHDKFLKIGHRLLAYTGGYLEPALASDITWNRVASPRGGEGGNYPLDLISSFNNAEIKETLTNTHRRYTLQGTQRKLQLGGMYHDCRRELDRILMGEEGATVMDHFPESDAPQRPKAYRRQLATFVSEYQPEALFDYCPPRAHREFPDFTHTAKVTDPARLGRCLRDLNRQLDALRPEGTLAPRPEGILAPHEDMGHHTDTDSLTRQDEESMIDSLLMEVDE